MANIWNKEKARQAGLALMESALDAGGSLTYSQGWEIVRTQKHKGVVTGILGSYATYDKIVKGLLDRGDFAKDIDPGDKRVTILKVRNADQAKAEVQFQRTYDQLKELMEQPSFPIPEEERTRHLAAAMRGKTQLNAKEYEALWKHPYLTQKEKVDELVKISHALFFKMEPKPKYDSAHYDGAYISAPHGDAITILSRSGHDNLLDCDRMLRRILAEGKKDPDKEIWLKQLGAYEP